MPFLKCTFLLGEKAIILSLKISPSLSAVIKILFGFFVNSFFCKLKVVRESGGENIAHHYKVNRRKKQNKEFWIFRKLIIAIT